ncbi:hypothetical protein Q8W71_12000 [Methylobacterium sp. NEAU 140]|uniref:hypothetical protein n=1 Tax=Methylobacterium sp. NEAU 140 TaxID=3064945 RepID=UPI00273429AB|nr:hypothetical protein [Methylobacterium sp. NEAU 140]MDP4023352.1 hypothetical protein [Methylobacterium sp. NEAU 140]
MKKLALGAMLALGLALTAAPTPGHAAGAGLDRNAEAMGNGRTGGMHRGAVSTSRQAMGRGHHRHHRRHHRRSR